MSVFDYLLKQPADPKFVEQRLRELAREIDDLQTKEAEYDAQVIEENVPDIAPEEGPLGPEWDETFRLARTNLQANPVTKEIRSRYEMMNNLVPGTGKVRITSPPEAGEVDRYRMLRDDATGREFEVPILKKSLTKRVGEKIADAASNALEYGYPIAGVLPRGVIRLMGRGVAEVVRGTARALPEGLVPGLKTGKQVGTDAMLDIRDPDLSDAERLRRMRHNLKLAKEGTPAEQVGGVIADAATWAAVIAPGTRIFRDPKFSRGVAPASKRAARWVQPGDVMLDVEAAAKAAKARPLAQRGIVGPTLPGKQPALHRQFTEGGQDVGRRITALIDPMVLFEPVETPRGSDELPHPHRTRPGIGTVIKTALNQGEIDQVLR
mgnify:CR=1 FL=1